jgi:oligosaccharide reducing-end xylanase
MKTATYILLLLCICINVDCKISKTEGSANTGKYRNLFLEAGFTQDEINKKIQKTFLQLFYGDKETETVYYEAGENGNGKLAYIFDVNSNDVRSEGMSYGMMIAVEMNRKDIFNAIWNWSKTYMYHSDLTHPAYGYFTWSLKTDGTPNDEMPAPDGEEYYTTALYFASARWGDSAGIYNYRKEADKILHDIRHRTSITGKANNRIMTAGNIFDSKTMLVRFTPDMENADHTDASYHLPAFYEVWARVAPKKERSFWVKVTKASRDYLEKAAHPSTGLTSDYGNFDGTPWLAPWNPRSAHFSFDSWRSAMNWSVDWAWWQKDSRAVERSNRILGFFAKQGMKTYGNYYTLEGKKLGEGQPTGLIAANATAALASTSPEALDFVKAFWLCEIPRGRQRYFDGMLMMMAMLHCSGEFKVYLPNP